MNWLALTLSLSLSTASSPYQPVPASAWRLVNASQIHVGLRPSLLVSKDEVGAGATVQVTINAL